MSFGKGIKYGCQIAPLRIQSPVIITAFLFMTSIFVGEVARRFQRTRYFDATVAALVRAGIRLLVSSGPDDTAGLLAQLALLEQRKGQGIGAPLEVSGRRQQALQFYLALPCVSYVTALHMCHGFDTVAQLVNR